MNRSRIAAAFIVLVLLGSYYFFFEYRVKKKEINEKEERETIFYGVEKNSIVKIVNRNSRGAVEAVKENGSWELKQPAEKPADKGFIEVFLDDIVNARASRVIETDNAGAYGIDPGKRSIALADASGKEYIALPGSLNPAGDSVYTGKAGRDGVFLLERKILDNNEKDFFDFRFKGILDAVEDEISAVKVRLNKKKYDLLKKDGYWSVSGGEYAAASGVKAIIDGMTKSNVRAFLKGGANSTYFPGASKEYIEFTINGKKRTVYFGTHKEEERIIFASEKGADETAKLAYHVYESIPG
ncbi:MAG TPA: DUF4340 domain-containing protein, partial [Firmicutes bacterium]|nr:DUF4340 domain-containing protein [Bacillota bacterium]